MIISVVVPVYQGEKTIDELVKRTLASSPVNSVQLEIILVDDGSTDNSWSIIQLLCLNHVQVKGVKLSKNFGQHHAITAGLDYCLGEWIVVMDCDLQDKPEEIANLLDKAKQGFDIVFARRHDRQDKWIKKLQSKLFYGVLSYLSGIRFDSSVSNFGIYNRKCINVFKRMREPMRAFLPMMNWVGFRRSSLNVEHALRTDGKSTYTLKKLITLALDFALAYSDKPLRLCIKWGFALAFGAFVYALFILNSYFKGTIAVAGYTSLMISIWFLAGILLFFLGVTGLYISKIFDAVKNRPLYIVEELS